MPSELNRTLNLIKVACLLIPDWKFVFLLKHRWLVKNAQLSPVHSLRGTTESAFKRAEATYKATLFADFRSQGSLFNHKINMCSTATQWGSVDFNISSVNLQLWCYMWAFRKATLSHFFPLRLWAAHKTTMCKWHISSILWNTGPPQWSANYMATPQCISAYRHAAALVTFKLSPE